MEDEDYDRAECETETGHRRYDPDEHFAEPGGNSALRAATHNRCPTCKKRVNKNHNFCPSCGGQLNPRNLRCPGCGKRNRLTPADVARGYQCDQCADRAEGTYCGAD